MKFLVGLGNPGKRYDRTPHNVGFAVMDRLASKCSFDSPRKRFKADYQVKNIDGERVFLVKPQTYMNLSGPAVENLMSYFKAEPADLLVVHDDLDLPLGRLRFRARGSAGGHNGVASIIESLGGGDFSRLKIGIGRDTRRDAADYVLGRFSEDAEATAREVLDRAVEAALVWVHEGMDVASQRFNVQPTRDSEGADE